MSSTQIQYLGHSTVVIRHETNLGIVIDPWLEGNPSCPDAFKNLDDIKIIILTHGHADHTSSAAELAKKTGAVIFATYELAMLMGAEGVAKEQLQPMNKGGCVKDKSGTKISLTHAMHSSSFDASDGKTYYAGEACGVVITLASGKAIYHAGDTALFSDMEIIKTTHNPSIALLPIGDRFTMGPKDAARAAKIIGAKTVIPIHHSTFPLLTGTPKQFEEALSDSDIVVQTLAPGEFISV